MLRDSFWRHGKFGLVAQLVERLPLKEMVPGSSPGWPTIKHLSSAEGFLFCVEVVCLLYLLAVLWGLGRFELWGDHLVRLERVLKFCGLD